MKRRIVLPVVLLCALTLVALLALSAAAAASKNTIIVATDSHYPPFEMLKKDKIVGFDVDLVEAIGERIGYKVEFRTCAWDDIIDGVDEPFDMAASAITITEERKLNMDFSDPYVNANDGLTVAADSVISSTDDLGTGDTIGVGEGYPGDVWATAVLEPRGVIVNRYEDMMAVFAALKAGTVDGVIMDISQTQYVLFHDRSLDAKIVQEIAGSPYLQDNLLAFAFPKGSALVEVVNGGLQEVMDDGTYAKIYRKWFGAEPWPLP